MQHPGEEFSYHAAPMPERERGLIGKTATSAISKNMPLSEVNRHCIPQDCWVAINGKVYDLTEFADRHPGGPTVILKWAGKDVSKMYNDIHKGVKIENYLRPESVLGDCGVDENLMSDEFWHTLRKARMEELKAEISRVKTSISGDSTRRLMSVEDLLKSKDLDSALKTKVQHLETQKRAALDAEQFGKAQEIKTQVEALLQQAKGGESKSESTPGGIPLSVVAQHNKPHDCWVALNGSVYDLTEVTLYHTDQRKGVLAWAGRDATSMWDKIPGRFPSTNWMEFYVRPDAKIGKVGPEPEVDPAVQQLHDLEAELARLEGPSEEDIAAAQKPHQKGPVVSTGESEESRFPKLVGIAAQDLPVFTRAEVAKHTTADEPWMIIHNKVYNVKSFLSAHPGGDEVLLSRAGTDCTKDFELFEHSEKSRVRRDQEMLIGTLIPNEHTDWAAEAAKTGGEVAGADVAAAGSDWSRYFMYKAADGLLAFICWYAYQSYQHRKPLSKLTYSRGLRHLHFIMAAGIFGALGSASAASRSQGLAKKRWLAIHKQTGLAMLVSLFVRAFLRLQSGIPPRFPGNKLVQTIETRSLQFFYFVMFVLPVSGLASEYFLKYASGDAKKNDDLAQQSITVHKKMGNFFQLVWLPFHLGYTTAYHYANGRGVVRKVSPFI